ncbi:MAG TPA: ATP/GTP-binding protein, partial [Myxococcaceae bacterium]|nr:ATP/GTP-binding protein [Myxococcaceae bacterium]
MVRDPLAERVLAGDIRAASRLMRSIEDGASSATRTLQALFPSTGRAWVVGVTGSPGSGKSTLTNKLIAHYRASGKRVGVIAVDPSSSF